MKIEELHAAHFPILRCIHDGFCPDPKNSIAIIATDNEEVIGRVFILTPSHIEGPWVRADKRNSNVGFRLIRAAEEHAKVCGIKRMFAYAVDSKIEDYLARIGYEREPMTVWGKDI